MQRIRIRYGTSRELRYTSTQDIQKLWERILRRADLPVSYSQGFHPQPKIQIACPLPLGMTSQSDYVDFWLEVEHSPDDLLETIRKVIHAGIEVHEIEEVPLTDPALQSQLEAAVYTIELSKEESGENVEDKIMNLLSRTSILRERRGKNYDLRPLIEQCELVSGRNTDSILIRIKLSARPGATGRPEEVLKALDIDPNTASMEREKIIFISPKS